jgi:hypothetical protein
MVVHTCEKCKKEFNKKSSYDYHIGKKNDCVNGLLKPPSKSFKCDICEKNILRFDNFLKHRKYCEEKHKIEKDYKQINYENLEREFKKIEFDFLLKLNINLDFFDKEDIKKVELTTNSEKKIEDNEPIKKIILKKK